MAYEGYGIRARGDLSANARPEDEPSRPMTAAEIITTCEFVQVRIKEAETRGLSHVSFPTQIARRMVDTMLQIEYLGAQR